jgi:hypothetical protein
MKNTIRILICVTALSVLPLWAADSALPPASKTPGTHETTKLKVIEVFSAKDGDSIFRAYLVSWKDQEVVVDDRLAQSDYHVGDTITVLVMNSPFPKGEEKHGLLHFQILPVKK